MKTANDPRHISRIKALEYLFSYFFNKGSDSLVLEKPNDENAHLIIDEVLANQTRIDQILNETAPQWTVENMKLIDLIILRIGVYEGFLSKKVPVNVAIDESIELAKSYGEDTSATFVNGILGALVDKKI